MKIIFGLISIKQKRTKPRECCDIIYFDEVILRIVKKEKKN